MRDEKMSWIIGIDEVGRGALAGPVAVAALALPQNFQKKYLRQSASMFYGYAATPIFCRETFLEICLKK